MNVRLELITEAVRRAAPPLTPQVVELRDIEFIDTDGPRIRFYRRGDRYALAVYSSKVIAAMEISNDVIEPDRVAAVVTAALSK